ncbi:MAG: SPOR domain-containing protein [Limnothrix sp.]
MIKRATTTTKICAVLSVGTVALGMMSTTVQAQVTVFEGLPPLPPNIPSLNQTPRDNEPTQVMPVPAQRSPSSIQEFNFTAPTATSQRYRVEVPSTDPLMLTTVQRIEPTAFMKGDRIQAGSFSQQTNAQNLQANLQNKGIAANIVTVASSIGINAPMGSSSSDVGYFVAIPTDERKSDAIQSQLRQAGINPNLIQIRTAPRGYHVAIGPFSSRSEASSVNTQIRGADLDGRLYFQD